MFSMKCALKIILILTFVSFSLGNSYSDYHKAYNEKSYHPQPHQGSEIESINAPKPGWIDPFDMLGETRPRDSLFVYSDVENHALKSRCTNYEIYLRRFVNLFLSAGELRGVPLTDNAVKIIKLEFLIDGKDINTLNAFGQGVNAPKVEFISDVFDKIFSQKTPQDKNVFFFSNFVEWCQRAFFKIISSPEWTVISSISLMLCLTLWFVYKTHSYRLAIFTVLLTIFCAGFGFTWIRMYEEKEVEKYVDITVHGLPRHCTRESQSMAWYEHMFYRMFGVDCYEFYKRRDVRPIIKISPTDVLAETFSSMVINPATNIGIAYGNFISNLMCNLPWWLKPIALPFSLILPIVFVVIILAFLFNYRLSLSITGFHLIPSWSNTPPDVTREERQYVEECPRKESTSQTNHPVRSVLESNTPVVVMNWMGYKKLSSSSLHKEKEEKKRKETTEGIQDEDEEIQEDQSLQDEEMLEGVKNFEKLMESLEQQLEDGKKRRSIHTCTGGSSSTSTSDIETTPMIEYSDLSAGDRIVTNTNTDKKKDTKDKMS